MKIEIINVNAKENEDYATIEVNKEEFIQLHNGCVSGSWVFVNLAHQFLPKKEVKSDNVSQD